MIGRELVIDFFCGGGGATCGLGMAGIDVDIAINHSRTAIAVHHTNHPFTRHYCQDVWQVDPLMATAGRNVALVWISSACTHFSKAKGRAVPLNAEIRDLSTVLTNKWIPALGSRAPRVIILENVEEFVSWGPLDADGRPDKSKAGTSFEKFVSELKGFGYDVEWRVLTAADYGVPTTRKRLFLIARRDGGRISWPAQTHAPARSMAVRCGALKAWLPASGCIDWSLPCPSIFDSSEEIMRKHGCRAVRPLAERTMRRIAKGVQRYVLDNPKPFIISYHDSKGFRGQGVDAPLATVDTSNRYGLVVPFVTKFFGTSVGQAMDVPLGSVTTSGAHDGLVYAFLSSYYGTSTGAALDLPMPTVTKKDRMGVVTVVVNGEKYVVSDIGMRMLTPPELAAAMGFPKTYVFDRDETGAPIGRTAQVSCIGNAVCPPMAAALASANMPILDDSRRTGTDG